MKETAPRRKHRILIVDDHPIVRYGISRILNKEDDLIVCGEAADGDDALQAIQKLKPDLALVDISLKQFDGLKLTKIIRTDHPDLPVLILSMHSEALYARKALRSGARGYIMKEESPEKLVPSIRRILQGEVCVSEEVKNNVLTEFSSVGPRTGHDGSLVETLSDRERQVFIMLGHGNSSRTIARKLARSIKTIETHRSRIKLKLAIETNHELLLSASDWAEREGIKPPMTL